MPTGQQIVRDRERLLRAMQAQQPIRIGSKGNMFVEKPASVLFDNTISMLRAAKSRLRNFA